MFVVAAILGAAWRRWFGSARPEWAFPGYRFAQIAAGWFVLFWLCFIADVNDGDNDLNYIRDAIKAALAIGFMTLPIQYSRQPFVWLARQLNLPTTESLPHPWKPMLQGPEPWGEAIQGACVWSAAITL